MCFVRDASQDNLWKQLQVLSYSQRDKMVYKSITPGADAYVCAMFYRYRWLGSL